MNTPKFIVLEGGDGAGKSSLLEAVKTEFKDSVLITREPGGSQYAEAIRELALKHPLAKDATADTMLCLMFAARFDHVANTIIPALESGKHVITDRFDASTFAYQLYAQESQELEALFWSLRQRITRLPDFYVYADVDVKEGLRRTSKRAVGQGEENHFDVRDVEFHTRQREGYKTFLDKVNHRIIDANQPLEKVVSDFMDTLREQGL